MSINPEIQTVMTLVPHSIGKEQTLKQAKELMKKHEIRHLPVCEGGRILGVISERDIHSAVAIDQAYDYQLTVNDILMPEPYIVSPTTKLDQIAQQMAERHIGCAVVEVDGKPVGIFTAVDACRVLGQTLRNDTSWAKQDSDCCC